MGGALFLGLRLTGDNDSIDKNFKFPDSKFGNFLALHHAIYVDDFDSVADLVMPLADESVPIVQNSRATALFLAGKIDDSAGILANDKSIAGQIAYATYLVKHGDWAELYKRFKNNDSQIIAPFRIWAGIAAGKEAEVMQFIDKMQGNDSWRNFLRGQVYAETGKLQKARESFGKVTTDFMNLNDYTYMMSFYKSAGFNDDADLLYEDFTNRPAGLHMRNFTKFPDFAGFSGPTNALGFGLIQNVSHSPILNFSSIALLLLRASEAISGPSDALNYYIGMFFYSNGSEKYKYYFNRIEKNSIFAPFVLLKNAEKAGNFKEMKLDLEHIVAQTPTFMPALNKLIAINMQKGREKDAFRVVNNALKTENLPPRAKSYFLTTRARLFRQTGNLERAQEDITYAIDILPGDVSALSEQAKIWILRKENLNEAYNIAMAMVASFPTDIDAWNTLSMAVREKEDADSALEILERVAKVSQTNSYLFENLGDIYFGRREFSKAKKAYEKALELSDDGLTSEPKLRSKIRKTK